MSLYLTEHCFRILPESVRWLTTKRKWDKLYKTLTTISAVNKKPISESVKKTMELPEDNSMVMHLNNVKYLYLNFNIYFIKL